MQAGLTGQTSVREMIVKNGGGGFVFSVGGYRLKFRFKTGRAAMSTINDPSQTRGATVYRHSSN